MNLMNNKFKSKEVDFLKDRSGHDTNNTMDIKPPGIFLSDILLNETNEINSFKKRIKEIRLHKDRFLCSVFRVSSPEKNKTCSMDEMLEKIFHTLVQTNGGLWQKIDKGVYAMAFRDYNDRSRAETTLKSIKKKISTALNVNICVGASWFPHGDYSEFDSFDNAVKALDHAAFFGEDALIYFNAVSIHIHGDRLYQLGSIEKASMEYQKGLELDASNTILINSLGVCYGLLNMLDKAKDEFKKVLKINPNEIISIYNLGLVHDLLCDNKKAVQYLKKASSLNNNIFEIELLLGTTLYKNSEPKKALYHIKKALELKQDSASALRTMGDILLEKNEPSRAASCFTRAVKLNPSDAASLSGLARAYEMQNKNIDIALSFAKKSVKLEPDNPLFRTRLGQIYLIKKEHDPAVKEFDKASHAAPENQKMKLA